MRPYGLDEKLLAAGIHSDLVCNLGACSAGGWLVGSQTDYYTPDSKTHISTKYWGHITSDTHFIAQGYWNGYIDGYVQGASYTYLYFTLNPGEAGAYAIIGGEQQYWASNNPSVQEVGFSWGSSNGVAIDLGIDTVAYQPSWGWGQSRIVVYGVPTATYGEGAGYLIDGQMLWARDLKSQYGFELVNSFGDLTPSGSNATPIGTGQAYTTTYGWGQSMYELVFEKPSSHLEYGP